MLRSDRKHGEERRGRVFVVLGLRRDVGRGRPGTGRRRRARPSRSLPRARPRSPPASRGRRRHRARARSRPDEATSAVRARPGAPTGLSPAHSARAADPAWPSRALTPSASPETTSGTSRKNDENTATSATSTSAARAAARAPPSRIRTAEPSASRYTATKQAEWPARGRRCSRSPRRAPRGLPTRRSRSRGSVDAECSAHEPWRPETAAARPRPRAQPRAWRHLRRRRSSSPSSAQRPALPWRRGRPGRNRPRSNPREEPASRRHR